MVYRARVFVDYWNFQLTLNDKEGRELKKDDHRFYVDWRGLGAWMTRRACEAIDVPNYSFDGGNHIRIIQPEDRRRAQIPSMGHVWAWQVSWGERHLC